MMPEKKNQDGRVSSGIGGILIDNKGKVLFSFYVMSPLEADMNAILFLYASFIPSPFNKCFIQVYTYSMISNAFLHARAGITIH